jgi:hypothetical protein
MIIISCVPLAQLNLRLLYILDVRMVCGGLVWNIANFFLSLRFRTKKPRNEKINVFWKGIKGGFIKRGQASEKNLLNLQYCSRPSLSPICGNQRKTGPPSARKKFFGYNGVFDVFVQPNDFSMMEYFFVINAE